MKKPVGFEQDPIAIELGHIIMDWAMIDHQLDQFIVELGRVDDGQVADIICGNVEFRSKIQIVKGLSFVRRPSEEWLSTIIRILDHIDNDLRPKRNLFAHAHWFSLNRRSKTQTLVTKKTKLVKPQSFKMTELETRQSHAYKISDLRKFRTHLLHVFVDLMFLFWYAMREEEISPDNQAEPPLSLQQYLRGVGYKIRSIRATPKSSPQKKPPRKAISRG
jgi:hypothetical protein